VIEVDDDQPGVPFAVLEIFPKAVRVAATDFGVADLVRDSFPQFDQTYLGLADARLVSKTILDKDRVEAIVELERLKLQSVHALTAFGISFSGGIAPLVAPPLLLASSLYLVICLMALRRLDPTTEQIRMKSVPPLLEAPEGNIIRIGLLILFSNAIYIGLTIKAIDDGLEVVFYTLIFLVAHIFLSIRSANLSIGIIEEAARRNDKTASTSTRTADGYPE
jgi:hypothetical protein